MTLESTNLSSQYRRRALRRIAREQPDEYLLIYNETRKTKTRQQSRGQALTKLRALFPDRYLELYAEEKAGASETEIPPDIRSKSWNRALARLADLRKEQYQPLFATYSAQGMSPGRASSAAMSKVRAKNSELFAKLLANEITTWMWMGQNFPEES